MHGMLYSNSDLSNKCCFPGWVWQVADTWLTGQMSEHLLLTCHVHAYGGDGFLVEDGSSRKRGLVLESKRCMYTFTDYNAVMFFSCITTT